MITSRGVKYTHNDHKHLILHPDSGPTRIRLIPTEHTQKKVVGDPPTPRHSVADPHAVAAIPQGGANDDPAVLTPWSGRFGRTVYILTPKHSILVKNS